MANGIRRSAARDIGLRVGIAIKRRRAASGLTQVVLGDRAGVSQSEVSLVESGGRSSLATLDRLCAALDVRLSDVVRFAEDVRPLPRVLADIDQFVQARKRAERRTGHVARLSASKCV